MSAIVDAIEAGAGVEELTRRVVTERTTVVIERGGEPQAVLLPFEDYRRLRDGRAQGAGWRELLKRTHEQILREGGGRLEPPPEQVIREMREERDAELLDNLR